jgi:hypothetical protein
MTFIEALSRSKADGEAYQRTSGSEWIRYDPGHIYKFDASDLLATDWESLAGQVRNGRWVATGETR